MTDKQKLKEIKDSWIRFEKENSKNEPKFLKLKLTDIVMEALNKEFKEQKNE